MIEENDTAVMSLTFFFFLRLLGYQDLNEDE